MATKQCEGPMHDKGKSCVGSTYPVDASGHGFGSFFDTESPTETLCEECRRPKK